MAGKPAPEEFRRQQILQSAFEVAGRAGLGGLTVRAVAAEAQLSHGLVLFYFKKKERLLHELLDWLLADTSVLDVSDDIARLPSAFDRLHTLLQQEVARVANEPRRTRLFFEYWALGARDATIRARIAKELERYRTAFREKVAGLLHSEPSTFAGITADGLAAVAISLIQGCAVQAMIDPAHFDMEEYLAAVRGIVGQFAGS
jgi:TetR/AcrR family transcriptional regulator, transcriptional repressor of bet genes